MGQTVSVYGPEDFSRETTDPFSTTAEFSVPQAAPYQLIVTRTEVMEEDDGKSVKSSKSKKSNKSEKSEKSKKSEKSAKAKSSKSQKSKKSEKSSKSKKSSKSSKSDSRFATATITLNGTDIVTALDFEALADPLEPLLRDVLLQQDNSLTITLEGAPGSVVTVTFSGEDSEVPVISATVTPDANNAGWHNQDVVVSFDCSDVGLGIVSCTEAITVAAEGADQQIVGVAEDLAGNSSEVTVSLNIDKTAPVVAIISPADGELVLDNPPVIELDLTDNLALDPESLLIRANGAVVASQCVIDPTGTRCELLEPLPLLENVTLSAEAVDLAGNPASTEINVSLLEDSDGDGVPDINDAFPNDPSESADADGDGIGDNADRDGDNDGFNDIDDAFPMDVTEWLDSDEDGTGDNADTDDDNDGVADVDDRFPTNPAESVDTDLDGAGNNSDSDDDNDTVADVADAFPLDPSESNDLDGDGIGDNADEDRDGDGVNDENDPFPDDGTRFALPFVSIVSPPTLTTVGSSPLTITGTVDAAAASVSVNGVEVPIVDNEFTADVEVVEGYNTIVADMVTVDGQTSTASIAVSVDLTPPYITIATHEDGQVVYTPTLNIGGLVNDIVRGTIEEAQATVTVNGVAASISNRSYFAENVPLQEGDNLITIIASDQVGNTEQREINIVRELLSGQRLELFGGQDQSAVIGSVLPQPLGIRVADDAGTPLVDKPVVFRVAQGAGVVGVGTDLEARGVMVRTDVNGVAQTSFRLGSRVGLGNQRVTARVVGFEEAIEFYATATSALGNKISINAGNNQRGAMFQPLPGPFIVAVTDEGSNVVAGTEVRFDVNAGGGLFQNGESSITVLTDSDGRASALLTLGGELGLDQQRVTATLLNVAESVEEDVVNASFTASAFEPGNPADTTISGLVLDNQDNAVPGVTIKVDGSFQQTTTDAEGLFSLSDVHPGPIHLIADGSTATIAGQYPKLAFNIVAIAGVDNPMMGHHLHGEA